MDLDALEPDSLEPSDHQAELDILALHTGPRKAAEVHRTEC